MSSSAEEIIWKKPGSDPLAYLGEPLKEAEGNWDAPWGHRCWWEWFSGVCPTTRTLVLASAILKSFLYPISTKHLPTHPASASDPWTTQLALSESGTVHHGLAAATWLRAWQPTRPGASATCQHTHKSQSPYNRRTHRAHTGNTPRVYNSVTRDKCAAGLHRMFLHKATHLRSGNITDLLNTQK